MHIFVQSHGCVYSTMVAMYACMFCFFINVFNHHNSTTVKYTFDYYIMTSQETKQQKHFINIIVARTQTHPLLPNTTPYLPN